MGLGVSSSRLTRTQLRPHGTPGLNSIGTIVNEMWTVSLFQLSCTRVHVLWSSKQLLLAWVETELKPVHTTE